MGSTVRTLEYIPLPFLDDNYAWLITDGMDAIVVDPGMAQPVIDYCDTRRLTLTGILLTHRHADNVGGVSGLLEWSSEHYLPVFGPAAEATDSVTVHLGHRSRVVIAKPKVHAILIAVPGHTKGAHCFLPVGGGKQPAASLQRRYALRERLRRVTLADTGTSQEFGIESDRHLISTAG
jgi:hydroxyacylglutathione hydrolase